MQIFFSTFTAVLSMVAVVFARRAGAGLYRGSAAVLDVIYEHHDFSKSCQNIALSGKLSLSAACNAHGIDAKTVLAATTELDLNLCIGLGEAGNQLSWEVYGKFSNYCSNCKVEGTLPILTCTCAPINEVAKNPATTSIALDGGIGNENGTLSCRGGVGSLVR
ncbi:hypothetical protein B0H63DRAFT_522249 [Podospora didyma]|uniref:Cyanovirin-N domain-containing protein n=1 Tax=Podospora didyma TaxID=330526 RepID=A0AAE0NNQ3_9PEZI|nr:hypothetical protein B0H63DRAFT_522249 [Podospora didyma]